MYYGMDELGAFAADEMAQPGSTDFTGPIQPGTIPGTPEFIGPTAPPQQQSAGIDWNAIAAKSGAAAQGLLKTYQQLELEKVRAKLGIPGTVQVPQNITVKPGAQTATNKWLVGGLVVAGLAVAGYFVWTTTKKKASNPGLGGWKRIGD